MIALMKLNAPAESEGGGRMAMYGRMSEHRLDHMEAKWWWICSSERIEEDMPENNTPDTNVGTIESEVEDE